MQLQAYRIYRMQAYFTNVKWCEWNWSVDFFPNLWDSQNQALHNNGVGTEKKMCTAYIYS